MIESKDQLAGVFLMVKELSTEEIVTNLLSSHEILKRQQNNFYINNSWNLGDYLKALPKEPNYKDINLLEKSKYTFITSQWII